MNEMKKLREVSYGSTIRFSLDGRWLKGHNSIDGNGKYKVYILDSAPYPTVELHPDTEVEVLQVGGFELTLS
jgi:hypothetical protein